MNRNTQRAAAAIVAAALMTTAFTGCSKSGLGGNSQQNGGLEISLEHSYAGEELKIEGMAETYSTYELGDRLLVNGTDEQYNEMMVLYDPKDGSSKPVEFAYPKTLDENSQAYPSNYFVDNESHLNVIFNGYSWEVGENGEEEYKDLGMTLEVYDADLNVLETRSLSEGDGQTYINSLTVNPAGGFFGTTWDDATGSQLVKMYDKDFKETGEVQGNFQYVRGIYATSKGDTYIGYDDNEGNTIFGRLDGAGTITPVEIQGMPQWYNNCFVSHDDAYDLYLYDADAVYGISFQKGTCEEVINWLNSDFMGNYISNVLQLGDGRFMVSNYSMGRTATRSSIWLLSPRDPDAFKDVELISMAGIGLPDELGQAVLNFNRTHDNARIAMVNYNKYNTDEDYEAGLKKMQTDMTSGIVADLIVTNGIPYESMANKGLFEDLTPYMTDYTDADYFTSFFKSMAYGDKLYNIGFSFDVNTVEGKNSVVGGKTGLTPSEYLDLLNGLPSGMESFMDMTKQNALYTLALNNISAYVDVKNGTCSFNSPEFIKLLEFCNTFPEEIADDGIATMTMGASVTIDEDEEYWRERDYAYINDKTALCQTYISNLRDAYRQRMSYFDDAEVTRIGYPKSGENGNGGCFAAYNTLAMSANSKNKELCWEFMQSMLSDEYQESLEWSLPVSRKAFAKLAEEATKPETYIDENGKEVEQPFYIWRGNEDIEIPQMPMSFADELEAYIDGITVYSYYDTQIYNIVDEETGMYFSGDQTAEKAAEMIQSRVTLYLSEQS